MITDHPESPTLSSTDEKSKSYEATSQIDTYEHPPPLYAPPPHPPHTYPPPANPNAPQAYGTGGTGQNWQYKWQSDSEKSSSSQSLASAPSEKHLSPTPNPSLSSSSVAIARPSSAPPGSDSESNHKPKRDPLDPPPPSFSRPVPPHTPLPPFPPLTLNSKKSALIKGFPIDLPLSLHPVLSPDQQQRSIHPFSQRDVFKEDWTRFLEDIYITAQLSTGQKIGLFAAHAVPVVTGVNLVGGILVTKAIHRRMKKKRVVPVADLIDVWNYYFFHKRGLHIILARGSENISDEFDGPAPDWNGPVRARKADRGDDSDSSSSSTDSSSEEEDDSEAVQDKKGTSPKPSRREQREARRARIRGKFEERREEGKARRAARKEHYRLVVIPIQITN